MEEVCALSPQVSLLVVDDNSADGTAREVMKLQGKYHNLFLIIRNTRHGLGGACKEGFAYALKEGYDAAVLMDADLSHSPLDIPRLLERLQDSDLVIGSRYLKDSGDVTMPFMKVVISKIANALSRGILRLPVRDITSGFRAAKRSFLEQVDVGTFCSRGYSFPIEMTLRAFRRGFKITEVPIRYQPRRRGRSKVSPRVLFETLCNVIIMLRRK